MQDITSSSMNDPLTSTPNTTTDPIDRAVQVVLAGVPGPATSTEADRDAWVQTVKDLNKELSALIGNETDQSRRTTALLVRMALCAPTDINPDSARDVVDSVDPTDPAWTAVSQQFDRCLPTILTWTAPRHDEAAGAAFDSYLDRLVDAQPDRELATNVRAWRVFDRLSDGEEDADDAGRGAEILAELDEIPFTSKQLHELVHQTRKGHDLDRRMQEGMRAPAFEMPILGKSEVATTEGYAGRVLMLDFWATWCEPCIEAMPEVAELLAKYGDAGFSVLGVACDADEEVAAFLAKNPVPWDNIVVPDGHQMLEDYGIRWFPTVLLVDREGVIIPPAEGESHADHLARVMSM